ncbi:MAG: hypothetical protein HQ523_15515 [Lentisphaerae bacterium]|nr:hypothetical protein [Lentisphaerota bacterium]
MTPPIQSLLDSGVLIPAPALIHIDDDVDASRIAPGTTLHPGTRLAGAATAIGPNCVIGSDGPVVLRDCQLGAGVALGSGTFHRCTLLDGVAVGPNAHIRPGCLLEEQSSCAHSVGLKHTLLMPHVIMGSLINFCDCMMTGGTSRTHHSEVGSSYIHFNYTPHGDKATPSLMGDVPSGVMLNQAPIFLGGQGGMVGPVRIAYGTVLAAGTIHRRDILEPGLLVVGSSHASSRPRPYQPGIYGDISRKLRNNTLYIGNLHALREWYRRVRFLFVGTQHVTHSHAGALLRLDELIDERVSHLDKLTERLSHSIDRARSASPGGLPDKPFALHQQFIARWPSVKPTLASSALHPGNTTARDAFLATLDATPDYLTAIKALSASASAGGTGWLQSIVDSVADGMEKETL